MLLIRRPDPHRDSLSAACSPVWSCFGRLSYFMIFPHLPYFRFLRSHSFFIPFVLFLFPLSFSVSFVAIASLLPVDPFTLFPMLFAIGRRRRKGFSGWKPRTVWSPCWHPHWNPNPSPHTRVPAARSSRSEFPL
jgi:hypothetical protein